jgi:hypothetical protein
MRKEHLATSETVKTTYQPSGGSLDGHWGWGGAGRRQGVPKDYIVLSAKQDWGQD